MFAFLSAGLLLFQNHLRLSGSIIYCSSIIHIQSITMLYKKSKSATRIQSRTERSTQFTQTTNTFFTPSQPPQFNNFFLSNQFGSQQKFHRKKKYVLNTQRLFESPSKQKPTKSYNQTNPIYKQLYNKSLGPTHHNSQKNIEKGKIGYNRNIKPAKPLCTTPRKISENEKFNIHQMMKFKSLEKAQNKMSTIEFDTFPSDDINYEKKKQSIVNRLNIDANNIVNQIEKEFGNGNESNRESKMIEKSKQKQSIQDYKTLDKMLSKRLKRKIRGGTQEWRVDLEMNQKSRLRQQKEKLKDKNELSANSRQQNFYKLDKEREKDIYASKDKQRQKQKQRQNKRQQDIVKRRQKQQLEERERQLRKKQLEFEQQKQRERERQKKWEIEIEQKQKQRQKEERQRQRQRQRQKQKEREQQKQRQRKKEKEKERQVQIQRQLELQKQLEAQRQLKRKKQRQQRQKQKQQELKKRKQLQLKKQKDLLVFQKQSQIQNKTATNFVMNSKKTNYSNMSDYQSKSKDFQAKNSQSQAISQILNYPEAMYTESKTDDILNLMEIKSQKQVKKGEKKQKLSEPPIIFQNDISYLESMEEINLIHEKNQDKFDQYKQRTGPSTPTVKQQQNRPPSAPKQKKKPEPNYRQQCEYLTSIGEVVGYGLKLLKQVSINWIIPCLPIYQRFYQLRYQILEQIQNSNKPQHKQLKQQIISQNKIIQQSFKKMIKSASKKPLTQQQKIYLSQLQISDTISYDEINQHIDEYIELVNQFQGRDDHLDLIKKHLIYILNSMIKLGYLNFKKTQDNKGFLNVEQEQIDDELERGMDIIESFYSKQQS